MLQYPLDYTLQLQCLWRLTHVIFTHSIIYRSHTPCEVRVPMSYREALLKGCYFCNFSITNISKVSLSDIHLPDGYQRVGAEEMDERGEEE